MQLSTFEHEKRLAEEGFLPIGVDEAGRGPLAGPVVACATLYRNFQFLISNFPNCLENTKEWNLVRDSKTLSPKQREKIFNFVLDHFFVGVGIVGPETIDRVNILQATFLAMKSAVSQLRKKVHQELGIKPEHQWILLIDGQEIIPHLSIRQEAIIDGDAQARSIAAASIVAKVTRDRIIVEADKHYPGYDFARHKGYGTQDHLKALRRLGPSPIHRMSFTPVKLSIPENVNRTLATLAKKQKDW